MEIYRIQNVSFTFPEQARCALADVDLTIRSGEFVTICGKSGSGKSTLLRHLKPILTPYGERKGNIFYHGRAIEEVDQRTQASDIGYVLQSPDNQIVTDKVWHELAFGMESLGIDQANIRLRVAEMASFFGIHNWFHKSVSELSGGQKQLLNLASIMAMHPSVLILDEPTSQLDPIAAADFLDTIKKINRDLGTTIIITEHRLEEVLPLSDRLIVMDQGRIVADDSPRQVGQWLGDSQHIMFSAMPSPMQIYAGVSSNLPPLSFPNPITVREGRQWLHTYLQDKNPLSLVSEQEAVVNQKRVVIQFKDVWFRYEKNGSDILKDLSFEVEEGQFYCIVGGNGTGKTTTLLLIAGIQQAYRGKVILGGQHVAKRSSKSFVEGSIGVLSQNPQTLFVKKTVEQDLHEMLSYMNMSPEEKDAKVQAMVEFAELEPLLSMHPYDLSGGEQQRAALAKVLLLEPKILLLDEPTKGLDGFFKEKLAQLLKKLQMNGVTIVMVSHDIEFCAKYGEKCALFFDGTIITKSATRSFFAGNSFYTTAANRMVRDIWPESITTEDVIKRCQLSQ